MHFTILGMLLICFRSRIGWHTDEYCSLFDGKDRHELTVRPRGAGGMPKMCEIWMSHLQDALLPNVQGMTRVTANGPCVESMPACTRASTTTPQNVHLGRSDNRGDGSASPTTNNQSLTLYSQMPWSVLPKKTMALCTSPTPQQRFEKLVELGKCKINPLLIL